MSHREIRVRMRGSFKAREGFKKGTIGSTVTNIEITKTNNLHGKLFK